MAGAADEPSNVLLLSDRRERGVQQRGQVDLHRITGANLATGDDDTHDPCLADQVSVGIAIEGGLHKPWLDAVELCTGISQSGHLDNGRFSSRKSVPVGSPSRSTPEVVTFSPICPGAM